MDFNEFDLHPDLKRGLADAGYITCMAVQEQVLQNAFGGQDLYVQSQTGTGKTAAFLIVIYQRLLTEPMLHGRKAIIMVPTRELAVQVEEEARELGKYLPLKTGSFYGGVGYTEQKAMLRKNVEIMVGTPGRVLDLNQEGQMNLMDIAFLVIDEADRMFDMGFYPDLRKLIRAVPPAEKRQTMLFSATLNAWVKNLAWEYTRNPVEIAIEPETVTVEEVDQVLYHVSSADKMRLLLGILKRESPESAIIFCNTKRYAEIVAKRLRLNGYDCEFIMGDLPQVKRLKIIDDIKAGKLRFLVATDVAARGLDIEGLALVVNYDVPNESENYVHRIGRTARAGKTGRAVTFASEQDVYELPGIERYIGQKIPSENATEELFAEDKSEGRRIETFDRGEAKSGKRGSERGPARGPLRAPLLGDKKEGRNKGPDKKTPFKKKPGFREKQKEQKPQTGANEKYFSPEQNDNSVPDAALFGMNLEERMAYYRSKYDKSPDAVRSGEKKPGPQRKNHRQRERYKGQNQNEGKTAAPGTVSSNEASVEQAAPETVPKKNLFSKLFGFVKKNKKDEENN